MSEVKYVVPFQVRHQVAGEETVIVDLESGVMFYTNETGSDIFKLLEKGHGLEDILRQLSEIYDEKPDALRESVNTFVDTLLDKQLISVDSS